MATDEAWLVADDMGLVPIPLQALLGLVREVTCNSIGHQRCGGCGKCLSCEGCDSSEYTARRFRN